MNTATATTTIPAISSTVREGDICYSVRGRPHSRWVYFAIARYRAVRRASDGRLTWRCETSYDSVRGRSRDSAERKFLAHYGERLNVADVRCDVRHGTPC